MKNNFRLPAWLLVFFGLVWFVVVAVSADHDRSQRHLWPLVSSVWLIILEAAGYWFIRTRNTQRDASLIHVLLLMLACASLFLREGVFIYSISRHTLHSGRLLRRLDRVQYTLFAGLLIVAHVFLLRVLRSAFAKQPETTLPSSP